MPPREETKVPPPLFFVQRPGEEKWAVSFWVAGRRSGEEEDERGKCYDEGISGEEGERERERD